jgi:hypothetical protein
VTISDLGQHAGEDFQAKVFFVPEAVRPPLDDSDLGVDALHELQGDIFLRLVMRRDTAPDGSLSCGTQPANISLINVEAANARPGAIEKEKANANTS